VDALFGSVSPSDAAGELNCRSSGASDGANGDAMLSSVNVSPVPATGAVDEAVSAANGVSQPTGAGAAAAAAIVIARGSQRLEARGPAAPLALVRIASQVTTHAGETRVATNVNM